MSESEEDNLNNPSHVVEKEPKRGHILEVPKRPSLGERLTSSFRKVVSKAVPKGSKTVNFPTMKKEAQENKTVNFAGTEKGAHENKTVKFAGKEDEAQGNKTVNFAVKDDEAQENKTVNFAGTEEGAQENKTVKFAGSEEEAQENKTVNFQDMGEEDWEKRTLQPLPSATSKPLDGRSAIKVNPLQEEEKEYKPKKVETKMISDKAKTHFQGKRKSDSENAIWKMITGHPYIEQLYATFYDSDGYRHRFISEHFTMPNLRDFIKIHKMLQTDIARTLTAQVASAILHMHSKKIFHRDVCSENICISSTRLGGSVAKLRNFRHSIVSATSKGLYGHFFYLAPEILTGEIYNLSADWYALGVCLYEMVIGMTPVEHHCLRFGIDFEELDFYGKIVVLINSSLYIPKVFPDDLQQALKDLLNKDNTKRLGYKDDMSEFKTHPFFFKIDWEKLENGTLTTELPKPHSFTKPKDSADMSNPACKRIVSL